MSSNWIDITEESPKTGQLILVWLSIRKEPSVVRYEVDSHGPLFTELVEVDRMCDREDLVTHWIPLNSPEIK